MTGSQEEAAAPRIEVTEHGPYRVTGLMAEFQGSLSFLPAVLNRTLAL